MAPLGNSPKRRLPFSRKPVSFPFPPFSNVNRRNRLIILRKTNDQDDAHSTKKNHNNDEKGHDKDEKKTSEKPTKSAEKVEHDSAKVLAEEVTTAPNPISVTVTHATVYSIGYNPDYTFTSSPRPSRPSASPKTTSSSTFIPLPPLPSAPPVSRTTFSTSPAASVQAAEASPTHPAAQPHKGIPVAAIATLAVGSALLLVGVFILIKAFSRPRRRTRPKPSLPILADPYADDQPFDIKEKDSPVFGGKERFSSQNGLWTLADYPPATVLPAPAQAAGMTRKLGNDNPPYDYNALNSHSQWLQSSNDIPRSQLSSHPMHSQSVPALVVSKTTPSYQNPLARAVSRFSTTSLSLYPQSPISAQDIGIAIGSSKAFTADGHPIMKRTPKAALRRSKSDVLDKMELGAYDGADVTSPKFAPHFLEAPSGPVAVGRSRIKSSYYTPGSYPRISTIPSSTSSKIRAENADPFASQKLPPLSRSDSRRNRDTKALASAIGLTSPSLDRVPPSPQPTIYPDDSLSVVDAKRASKRVPKKSKHSLGSDEYQRQSFQMLKEVDTSALGTMMLNMDFGATNKSLATLAGRLGENLPHDDITSGSSGTLSGAQSRGAPDKPPRVPSPPPLPSLTQMGLEHANPAAYANYRSPTYSIFGLYEDERKSNYHYR
ncbi:uncharacterized protein EV420DRAFT_1520922 [Desarmillaria tabescens]|uniref:Uncharacterized protein n=1 Tax=Armillaria tabescens TaxID=1929756 RepID=A0AA39NE36_ARMTA|nr:uncharacterized protein EV420DRAFT_1520922 [Desarmillaria tabescens]KAK0463960.1 hypothetical protein EV420DRAFT_1520922 [Desarmillaria tabescens]